MKTQSYVPSLEEIQGESSVNLQACARNYLDMLARDIAAGCNHWPIADAIEARFNLAGYCGQMVDLYVKQRAATDRAILERLQTYENKMAVSH